MAGDSTQQHSGQLLADRYQVAEPLAQGATAAVYRGQDLVLRRPIAVKAVAPEHIASYRAALRHGASLTHPALISVYDALEHDGWLYIVQEYIAAKPIGAYLQLGVPAERALALIGQLTRLLAYIHQRELVHGDLSASAVLVDRQALVRVNNVGLPADEAALRTLARAIALSAADERATAAGAGAVAEDASGGTVMLAPDDPRVDVWAAGALLWQLLTLPPPASADAAGAAAMVRRFRPDVSEPLRALVRRCVFPASADRLDDATALAAELGALSEQLAQARPHAAPQTPLVLRAARDAIADIAAADATAEITAVAPRGWKVGSAGSTTLGSSAFNAPTDPFVADIAATQPAGDVPALSLPPRLGLPSRPIATPSGRFSSGARVPRWVPVHGADRSNFARQHEVASAGTHVSLLVVLVLGGLLFLIFFVIGFVVPPILAR